MPHGSTMNFNILHATYFTLDLMISKMCVKIWLYFFHIKSLTSMQGKTYELVLMNIPNVTKSGSKDTWPLKGRILREVCNAA